MENETPQLPTFREFHDQMRQRCRMARRYRGGEMILDAAGKPVLDANGKNIFLPRTYTRPLPKTVKGKAAIRAAKRKRVREMKATQLAK